MTTAEDSNMNLVATKVIKYIQTLEPKTEDEQVEEIKEALETEELNTVKDIKKRITEITQPFDYKQICEEILKRFGIVYKPADIKKLMSCIVLLPK